MARLYDIQFELPVASEAGVDSSEYAAALIDCYCNQARRLLKQQQLSINML
jgi:hypothetical protein